MVRCRARRLLIVGCIVAAVWRVGLAQAPATGTVAPPRVYANMLQVMRGVLYPASNVIFTAQSDDPASFKPALRPSTSSDPLTSAYGGWEAVENAGLALAEAANLLIIPGRLCGNGRPAPVQNADWQTWVQELRDAGMAAYKAGQAKDADAILIAAGAVSEACLHCHQKYRQVPGGFANRCQAAAG
jgi:hypothetical protein